MVGTKLRSERLVGGPGSLSHEDLGKFVVGGGRGLERLADNVWRRPALEAIRRKPHKGPCRLPIACLIYYLFVLRSAVGTLAGDPAGRSNAIKIK